jgi:hypothetical protein
MLKSLSAGTVALALIASTGLVHAQETTDKEKTVIQNPDGSQTVNKSKTEQTTDDDGSQHMERHDKNSTIDPSGHKSVTEQNSEADHNSDGSSHHETTTDTHRDD